MKASTLTAIAAGLLATPALAIDTNVYPAHRDHYNIILPDGWQTDTNLSAGASYTYFDLAGPAQTEADGYGLHLLFRGKIEGGFFGTLQADHFWIADVPRNDVSFGYGRAGLGYHHEFTPHVDLGVEGGAVVYTGDDAFGDASGDVAPYARLAFRTKLIGESDFAATASYSEHVRTGELRWDIPIGAKKRYLVGLVGTVGAADYSDFWSVGPSLRFVFDR